ncbi:MAG: hypothetical protein AVDCRST_MAG01-01-3108, partial [uncultured Rubrobacteraceae bacterium]
RVFFPAFGTLVFRVPAARVYSRAGYNSTVGIFRTDRIPSLSRIPAELGREQRPCEPCGHRTEHILYRVPKKLAFVYLKDHPKNLQATCIECARSTVLTGEDRKRVLETD